MDYVMYFKNIHKQYRYINLLLTIAALLLMIIAIDYFNLFTFAYNKLELPI